MATRSAPASFLWPNWLTLALGAWLFISPWTFTMAGGGYSPDAWVVGFLIAALSIGALAQVTEWEDWGNLILGAWLFISPWVLGYSGVAAPAWNSYLVGLAVAAISIWGIVAIRGSDGHAHA